MSNIITMNYSELLKSFADPDKGLQYTCAEKVFHAVTRADPDQLLDELECAQHLEQHEIEGLLSIPLSNMPITARDVVFAMKTLIHLHQLHVRESPKISPSWEKIIGAFPVGSVHSGKLIRRIEGGYLFRLSKLDTSTHGLLPYSDSIPVSFDRESETRLRIHSLVEESRSIIVAMESDS